MNDHNASTAMIPSLDPENIPIPSEAEIELTADTQAIKTEESASYAREYDQALMDLRDEQHQSLGLLDTVKTMFMWKESPEERVRKNRSLRVDPS